jgi:hypothetical protein
MAGIAEALDLIKKAGDLVKSGATIGLQETIMDLRHAVLDVKDEVLTLRAELQAYKAKELEADSWKETEALYPLVKAPGGAMVRQSAAPPEHYVCPKCFVERHVYPLQDKRVMSGDWTCPGCRGTFPVDEPTSLGPIGILGSGGRGGPDDWMAR